MLSGRALSDAVYGYSGFAGPISSPQTLATGSVLTADGSTVPV